MSTRQGERIGRSEDGMARALVRLNAHLLGLAIGLLCAAALFLATLVLIFQGGSNTGQMLLLLHYFFPGYAISLGGAFIGALWAGITGYVLGLVPALAYGRWFLQGTINAPDGAAGENEIGAGIAELRPLPFGLVSGGLLAAGLVLATNWLWFRYGFESPTLGLLGNFLPGYATNPVGSLIGAFWIFLYGSLTAASVAGIYGRVVAWRHPQKS